MKRKLVTPTAIAIIIYLLYSLVDRFLIEVPMTIAIPIVIFCIVLIVIGNLWTPKAGDADDSEE